VRVARPTVHVSILWRVFTVNAVVFAAAVGALIVTPATVHRHVRVTEMVVLFGGLLVMLVIDLALLALVLAPVRGLARLMGDIDPLRPGLRAGVGRWASSEAEVLARALNTMLDRVEDERRESARRALGAREAERLRIARELHDEVGQTLTAVALRAERAAGGREGQREALEEISSVVQTSLADVRRIARELRPEALDDLGLTDALIALCMRVERMGATRVLRDFEGGLPALSPEVELVLYRVAQEALTNAMRHADAGEIRVTLRRADGPPAAVRLSVLDNGAGPGELDESGGGLQGMRERAMLIGAELELGSQAGGGLAVSLTVVAEGAPV
jgi:two-component system sensor histidine kinase UhpB